MYDRFLPDNHAIYIELKQSTKHTTISTILSKLQPYDVCEGLDKNEHTCSKCVDPSSVPYSSDVIRHTAPIKPEKYEEDGPPFQACIFLRSANCELLCDHTSCSSCTMQERSILGQEKKAEMKSSQPLQDKAPLSKSSKDRLVATVQKQRITCKELEGVLLIRKRRFQRTASLDR